MAYPWNMSLPAKKAAPSATYADLVALPENLVGEILAGELVVSPRPAPRHARAASSAGGLLSGPFDFGRGGPGGWWILDEPELHLGADVVVPDLGGWRRSRMPALPEAAFFELAPDWVCEVLSPSTQRYDRVQKLAIYARVRVAHYWLIDPTARTLEVLRLDGEGYRIVGTHVDDAKVRAEPFDAVELELGLLWA